MKAISLLKAGLTTVIGAIGWFVGGYDTMIITLLIFIVIDYLSGVMCAIINKRLSSEVGFKGIFKKIMIILLVGLTNLLGQATGVEGLRYIIISFIIYNFFFFFLTHIFPIWTS